MRKGARDSQIVNNFFTLASILIIAATLAIYTKYFNDETDDIYKPQKIPCQLEIFTKTKTFNQKLLDKSIVALNKGYYKIDGGFIESIKDSKIKDVLSIDESNRFFLEAINIEQKNDLQKYLKIKYEIIESDNSKEKLNAGIIQTSFRINSVEIFRVDTHFDFLYKNAIKDRIDCTIKVFKNHVQNSK